MIKDDLIRETAKIENITNKEAASHVEAVLKVLKKTIENGEEIEIRDFGCFRIREQGPRPGRNPKTGEEVQIPARKRVYFKLSRNLRIKN